MLTSGLSKAKILEQDKFFNLGIFEAKIFNPAISSVVTNPPPSPSPRVYV